MNIRLIALPVAVLLATGAAQAAEFNQVDAAKSTLAFSSKQMGVPVPGSFKRFTSQISFDPAKPTAAHTTLEIDLASIDAGSSDADDEVIGKTWFNVKAFPKATFVAKQIKATGAYQFDVTGVLTIKGKSQDIKFPLKLVAQGNAAVFSGGFVMRRADFAIGEGMWAKFDVVANDIQVNFQLTANSGK